MKGMSIERLPKFMFLPSLRMAEVNFLFYRHEAQTVSKKSDARIRIKVVPSKRQSSHASS